MERFGVHLSQQLPPDKVTAVATLAEDLGYERFFFSDHLMRDPFAILTACALATSRITIGTAVMPLYERHPVSAAVASATLAHISNDRFIFGVGTSHREMVEPTLGIPWTRPVGHLREYIDIVRGLHSGEQLDYQGDHYRVSAQLAFPPARPVPIYLGPAGPRMFQISGEIADGVVLNWGTPEYLGGRLPEIKAAATAAGRDPADVEIGCSLWCQVTDDDSATARAREDFRERATFFASFTGYRRRFAELGFAAEMEAFERAQARGESTLEYISDPLLDAISIIGDLETCRGRFDEYRAAGIEIPFIVPITSEDGDLEPIRKTLTALAH